MSNAVIYARYSSSNQNEQSIEGQLRDCYTYAKREGLTVIHEYIDRAISGRSDDRPDFQQMIADSEKKQFQYVIVWKLDRFARNRYDSAIYKRKLKLNGVKVLSAMENIGEGDESIILEAVLEASAEYYSRDLSKKTKRGLRESALKGYYISTYYPYGYKVVDKRLVVDENQAPMVRFIFESYAAGMKKKDIAKELNRMGYRTHAGKPFSSANLQAMLKNKKYIGIIEYKTMGINIDCDPIISDELFQAVQDRIEKVKRAPSAGRSDVEYKLQGKIYCGYCGNSMRGMSAYGKHGDRHTYYACSTKRTGGDCKKRTEHKEQLEQYIVRQTVSYVLKPDNIKAIAAAVVTKSKDEFSEKKVLSLQGEIQALDFRLNQLIETLTESNNKTVIARLNDKITETETLKDEKEDELAKLKLASSLTSTEAQIETWLRSFCIGDQSADDFQSRIIDIFINSVFVYDDHVAVFYNIKSSRQITYTDMLDSVSSSGFDFDDNVGG